MVADVPRPQLDDVAVGIVEVGGAGVRARAERVLGNLGPAVALPQRSSRNYFANPGGIVAPASQRGQPSLFQAGVQRSAFTVAFDPVTEPLLVWEIDGESVPAALGLPNVPLCTPLANVVFANGLESSV